MGRVGKALRLKFVTERSPGPFSKSIPPVCVAVRRRKSNSGMEREDDDAEGAVRMSMAGVPAEVG